MNRTILYYPTIDIPRNSWLRHALLYWDEVSSIVPKSWDDELLIKLSPDIHYLIDENQFRPIKPEDLFSNNWEVLQEFQNEFIEVINSHAFSNLLQRNKKEANTSKIHMNKTSHTIYHYLEERGLASQSHNHEWINLEENTALLYMSLLAKYLADIDSEHTTIGTDYSSYERFNFKRAGKEKGFPVLNFNINNILPTPKDNVSFEEIIKFKRKRIDNLRHFKKTLSDFQSKISNCQSNTEIKENTINFKETLSNGVDDLYAVLKDEKIAYGLKSMRSFMSLKSPTTAATIGSALNLENNWVDIPFSANIAILVASGVIEVSTNIIDARNRERARIRENPFSYIYYANRWGIINRPK
jgi:murein tripeptide amidase MpaA